MSSIKKNFFYNSILSVSRIIFPLISFPYSSRILGPDGIGKINFVDSYSQYFCLLAALGIPLYGIREVAKTRHDPIGLKKLTSELLVLNFLGSLICCVFYFVIAILTHKYAGNHFLFILGAIGLLLTPFPAEWFFQGMEKFKYVATRSFFLNIVSLILLFTLVKSPADATWYYAINIITLTLNVLVNLRQLGKETTFTFKDLALKRHIKPLTLLFSSQVAISVYVLLDKVILGYMADDKYLGYYASSLKIAKVLLTVISALAIVMVPQMSKAFKDQDMDRIHHLYRKAVSFVHTIGIPITAGLICLSDEIIILLTGREFLPATTSLVIIAPIVFLIGLNNIFGMQILTANGKERLLLRSVLAGTVLNVVANLVLIPFWYHNGASVAITLTELLVAILTGYFACKEINVKYAWGQLLVNCLVCVPFWGIYNVVRSENMILTIALTAVLCSIYYAIMEIFVLKETLWVENYVRIKKMVNERI
ncbi:flippase [Chitinophaga silvisoli]|uniref:Flippase n=1 Tax=Chitinophaga silvisoli TaxID=2291814 RepID=A0A3E1P6L8_9BACT|nr:flippase [Chitinophaga silvisoli]RFM35839.1 flippase [Chitinophaga silvisoli]